MKHLILHLIRRAGLTLRAASGSLSRSARLSAFILSLALVFAAGCANQTTAQKIATGQQIFSAALDGWSATHGGQSITPQAVQEIGNNLFAIAAATQANVGQTPTAANVAQYSADPNVGSNVQLVLPNTPITQAQADAAFTAAQMATAAVARTP